MRILGGAVLILALAGCTTPPAPAAPAAPAAAVTSAAPGGPIDCGSWTLTLGEGLPDTAAACFTDAFRSGEAVRLEQTQPSVEGYPNRQIFVFSGAGPIDVTHDASEDPFGGHAITRTTCTGVERTEYGGLVPTGCTERP